jgi:hypothetical protein
LIAVGIDNIEFAHAIGGVLGWRKRRRAVLREFGVKRVRILDEDSDAAVAGKTLGAMGIIECLRCLVCL